LSLIEKIVPSGPEQHFADSFRPINLSRPKEDNETFTFPSQLHPRLPSEQCLSNLTEVSHKRANKHRDGFGTRNRRWSRRRCISRKSMTSSLLQTIINISQGRAGLVALRRSRGEAVGALGKAFYKGGFEPKMNRREAALILQLRYASTPF
jgi:hypothetical protein